MEVHLGVLLELGLVLFVGIEVVQNDVTLVVGKAATTLSMNLRNSTRRRHFECEAMIFSVATWSAANSVVVPWHL
jgi:hypothetical protein